MNLPFFKKNSQIVKREYLFALEIGNSFVKSAVWSVVNDKPHVISIGGSSNWDGLSEDGLITAADASISEATNRLDSTGRIQPEKVILGLPIDWMGPDKILPDRLSLIKAACSRLSISPVGFVVTSEACASFLQKEEGVPPSVVLVGIWNQYIEVTYIRTGKIQGNHLVKRSSTVQDDLVEGLSRLHADMLPSRILLYTSDGDLEEVRQSLLGFPWLAPQTKLPFLHFPKIESLSLDFSIRAIALSGGREVAQSMGLIVEGEEPKSRPNPHPDSTPEVADLGFTSSPPTEGTVNLPESEPKPDPEPETIIPDEPKPTRIAGRFSFPKISFPTPVPNFPTLFVALVVALLVVGFAAHWFLSSARVTVVVATRQIPLELEILADTKLTTLPESASSSVPAKFKETQATEESSVPTTGSKLVGDRATGTVTIVNGTGVPRSFAAGTQLSSPTGLKFTLDTDIQVASASGTADPNSYLPGKADVKVTASQIGTDSNLSAGTEFRIGSFSSLDYVAKNSAALSGGSSRQVKAVSKDDIAKLRSELTSKLRDQVKAALTESIEAGEYLVVESITTQVVSEEFDKKVDEISDTLKLKLVIKSKGLTVSRSDFNSLIEARLFPQIPAGFVRTGDIDKSFTVRKTDSSSAILGVTVSGRIVADIDESALAKSLVGELYSKADSRVKAMDNVTSVSFSFKPKLPIGIQTLPRLEKNIKVIVETETP